MHSRAQTSVELLIILAVSLTILAVLIDFTSTQLSALQKESAVRTTQQSMQTLIEGINRAFLQGPGTVSQIQVTWPQGLSSTQATLSGKSIIVQVYDTDVSGTAIPLLGGSLSTNPGTQTVKLTAFDTYVQLGSNTITPTVSSVYLPMAQDSNQTAHITLTNLSNNPAALTLSFPWSSPYVGASISPMDGNISANGTFSFDLSASAGASAIGNYVGIISISAAFTSPSFIETVSIPVNIEVFPTSASLFTATPGSLAFTNFGTDSNTLSFELCNAGLTDMNGVSFTRSAGNAGDWVEAIDTIPLFAGESCQTVNVTVTAPPGNFGSFTGSILVKDYTGANSLVVPITVVVNGQSSIFDWDWETSTVSLDSVSGFTIENGGSNDVVLSSIVLSRWGLCDSGHHVVNTLVLRGETVFSGSSGDGNTMDIADTTLEAGISDANNSITFSGAINNEGEQFFATVTFSDGSTYMSSVYGNGCVLDVTPPAKVTTLSPVPGGEPGSINLNFLFSGDDNYSGTATRADFRYSLCSDMAGERVYGGLFQKSIFPIPFSIPFLPGLSSGTLTKNGLNVGFPYFFTAVFYDEADNNAGMPLAFSSKPYNQFSVAGNDFNFANVPQNYDGMEDINKFVLSNFVSSSGDKNVVIRIASDADPSISWILALRFRGSNVGNIRIWYPGGLGPGIPGTPPQYERTLNKAPPVDLLSTDWIDSEYRYNGSSVDMISLNHLYLDQFSGFSDMNLTLDAYPSILDCGGGAAV